MTTKIAVSVLALTASVTLGVVNPASGVTCFVGYVIGYPFTIEAKK